MLEQYKKTFARMQAVIAIATIAIFMGFHHMWSVAALFFAVMQVGAVVGAMWGHRLKKKVLRGY